MDYNWYDRHGIGGNGYGTLIAWRASQEMLTLPTFGFPGSWGLFWVFRGEAILALSLKGGRERCGCAVFVESAETRVRTYVQLPPGMHFKCIREGVAWSQNPRTVSLFSLGSVACQLQVDENALGAKPDTVSPALPSHQRNQMPQGLASTHFDTVQGCAEEPSKRFASPDQQSCVPGMDMFTDQQAHTCPKSLEAREVVLPRSTTCTNPGS